MISFTSRVQRFSKPAWLSEAECSLEICSNRVHVKSPKPAPSRTPRSTRVSAIEGAWGGIGDKLAVMTRLRDWCAETRDPAPVLEIETLRSLRAQRSVRILAGVAALALLSMLMHLPAGFGTVHVAALCAAAAGLAALHLAGQDRGRVRQTPAIEQLSGVGDRLEQRIEVLQDLQWEISEREVRYRDLLDQQHDVIVRRDSDGRLTFANRAFARVFGQEPEAAIGHPFALRVLEGPDTTRLLTEDNERRRTSIQLVETVAGPRWMLWDEQLVPGAGVGQFEFQCVGRDVTESNRIQAELTAARDQAEAANRAKSRFLAAMSHEIRTPMNGILGMSSLLIETAPTTEQQTYVEAIDYSARTLLALIDEILDFSKIEAGKLVLAEAPFSLAPCVEAAVELLAPRAYEKGLEIAWTLDADLPRRFHGDEARIRQLLLNLLSNAIKFTDVGGIVVHVSGKPAPDDKNRYQLSIAVRDTGIGLSEEDKKSLFMEFEQADAALRRRNGGTGLGLAISKRIAGAMGGDISVVSSPGHGSTFTITIAVTALAAKVFEPDPDRVEEVRHDADVRVVLAMQGQFERTMLRDVLQQANVPCVAVSPRQAVEVVRRAATDGVPFNRIVVDAGGRSSDAAELLAEARAAAPAEKVRGVLLVNVLARAALRDYREAGFDAYLVRPVRPAAFLDQLGLPSPDCPSERRAVVADANRNRPFWCGDRDLQRQPRVLLAEDNDINALLARRMIEGSGCVVEWVKNGQDAIDRIQAAVNGEAAAIDLVLMDIFMPHVDGVEAAQRIMALFDATDPTVSVRPPIVALTANAFAEDRRRYVDAGMDDYLSKPFDRLALDSVLERWLPRSSSPGSALPRAQS